MATLSKKFKKSNKSKSSSRSRKHFNKSRKNGLKTKKMMRGGGAKEFGKPKQVMVQPVMKSPVMAQPVTMTQLQKPFKRTYETIEEMLERLSKPIPISNERRNKLRPTSTYTYTPTNPELSDEESRHEAIRYGSKTI